MANLMPVLQHRPGRRFASPTGRLPDRLNQLLAAHGRNPRMAIPRFPVDCTHCQVFDRNQPPIWCRDHAPQAHLFQGLGPAHGQARVQRVAQAVPATANPLVKMRDIAIRGKTYSVRASFVADNEKFEATIVKTCDKKSEEALPDKIIELTVNYINDEEYFNTSLTDEVNVYVFAAACGVKSLMKHALARMKEIANFEGLNRGDVVDICCLVCIPTESDEPLKQWLKNVFDKESANGFEDRVAEWPEFLDALSEHPQLYHNLTKLLGRLQERPGRRKPRCF